MTQISTRSIISVSLPPSLIKQVDKLSLTEDRSRSAVIRRALVEYVSSRIDEESPESGDLRAVKTSSQEYELKQGMSLQKLENEMELIHSTKRSKTRS